MKSNEYQEQVIVPVDVPENIFGELEERSRLSGSPIEQLVLQALRRDINRESQL
jgi:hypothetical protein